MDSGDWEATIRKWELLSEVFESEYWKVMIGMCGLEIGDWNLRMWI